MKINTVLRRTLLCGTLLFGAGIFDAQPQGQSSKYSTISADGVNVDDTHERVNPHNPNLALAALIDARDIFVQQQHLLIDEIAYERALAIGEHPKKPVNYTSSSSQLALVRDAARSMKHCAQGLENLLALPENSQLDPQVKSRWRKRLLSFRQRKITQINPFWKNITFGSKRCDHRPIDDHRDH